MHSGDGRGVSELQQKQWRCLEETGAQSRRGFSPSRFYVSVSGHSVKRLVSFAAISETEIPDKEEGRIV